ncbi:MAG: 4-aminobutyrate--2-oxoglutarate transaminase [Candidatus Hecatellaceae archaeon]
MSGEAPKITVTPPGPRSQKLMELRNKYVANAVYNVTPLFIEQGEGAILKDVDGNVYIDFATGISSVNLGHRHPEVVEAIKNQLEKYMHLCFHVTPYEPYVRLAEKLASISPGDFAKKVVLVNSGAEAVENAVKVVRRYTRKPGIICFENAFHGRTLMALALTGGVQPYKYGFGPFMPEVYRVPFAYCYRCSFGLEYPSCNMRCVEYIRELLQVHISPDDVAAIIFEPVQGEGGFIVPPREFVQGLRKICDEFGLLLIDDEVQAALGRSGKMFGVENFDVTPDVITMAKSLGGGLPLAATIGRQEIMDAAQVGGLGGTFGGNPVSCVAGLKVIEIVEKLLPQIPKLGELAMGRLRELHETYEIIGDVRGLGLMVAMELVEDRKTKKPAANQTKQVLAECYKNGLVVLGAGSYKNVIRMLPPLTISEELLNKGFDIIEKAVKTVSAAR